MSLIRRFKKIVLAILLIGFASLLLIFQSVIPSDFARAQEQSPTQNLYSQIKFGSTAIDDHRISFAYAGDANKAGVLFLHGTPGSWNAFDGYLANRQMQRDFFMVSVDRLGWGNSPIPPQIIDGDFTLQARSVIRVMNLYPEKKWTIVGHSLGASMAPKVAIMSPQNTHSLLLLAGSLDPALGRPRWYNSAASTWVVSRLIGKTMRYSNREIMGLKKQLEKMAREVKEHKLPSKLVVMQGQKDRLVSPKNPAFVEQEWKPHFSSVEIIRLPKEGHFLPWRQVPLVIQTIYALRQVNDK